MEVKYCSYSIEVTYPPLATIAAAAGGAGDAPAAEVG
jgi:hypothetical protein